MKKIWASVLALSMVLSMMGALSFQASAMGENESYPLLYETYETAEARQFVADPNPTRGTITITKPGVNGSGSALHVHQISKGNYIDVMYPMSGRFTKGQKVNVSYWIKLNSELKTDISDANRISLIFYGTGIVTNPGSHAGLSKGDEWTGSGWKQYDVSNKLVLGEWVKVEHEITWEDAMSIGSGGAIDNISLKNIALRVANLNGTNAVVDGKPLDYELDDFVISYPDAAGATKLSFRDDFDGEKTTGDLDGRSEDCSPKYRKIVYTANQVDAELGYIKDKQANYSLSNIRPVMGRVYKISGWFRFDADDTATDFVAEKAELRLILMGKDKNDTNFEKSSNYPSFFSKSFPEGEWTFLEYYFYMDYRTYVKNASSYLYMRICPYASYKGGDVKSNRDNTIPGTYSFDNIKVEEVDRGTMELDPSVPVAKNFVETTQVIPGWIYSGTSVEAATENGNTYLKATTTAGSHGSVQSPYAFENGKKYKISFRAKLDNLEDGVTQPISLILDRKVTTAGADDSYTVPNYEYLIGGNKLGSSAPGNNHPWHISNRWQEFSTIYTTNFPIKAGMEEKAPTVNPKCATSYIYTYAPDGKVSPHGTILCLDDYSIEEITEVTANNISFAQADKSIRVNYDFVSVTNETENKDATLIRAFLKNGETETNIGTFSGNETFVVPPVAVGKTIWFEVTPVDTNGNIGKSETKACNIVFNQAEDSTLTVSADKKSITWSVDASKIDYVGTSYRIGAAVYADDFSMLYTDLETYALTEGVNSAGKTFSVPEGAKSVKLFVWDAEGNAPLMKPIEIDLTK